MSLDYLSRAIDEGAPSPTVSLRVLGSDRDPGDLPLESLRIREEGRPRALTHLVGKGLLAARDDASGRDTRQTPACSAPAAILETPVSGRDILGGVTQFAIRPLIRGYEQLILKTERGRVIEGARLEIALAVCDGVLQISMTVAKPTT